MTTTSARTYEEVCAQHRWNVPERYNIAADVCDKHARDKLAMVWEDWRGNERRVSWGELQDLAAKVANVLRERGVERGDRVAMLLPATPETAAAFFGTWKAGAILLSMSVLYGDEGIRHRVEDSQAKVVITNEENADRIDRDLVEEVLILDDELLADASTRFETVDTAADDPAQLYYSSGTTGLAKGILHAHRYVLAHEEFIYCHDVKDGELFHGMGEWAWAAGIAPLIGPWRLGATQFVFQRQGGFDPEQQLAVLSKQGVTNVFTTPTAMRSMMGVDDAGSRYPQQFRIVCSAGEPLNPEAIRWFREQYGLTVLDFYGLTESYPSAPTSRSWRCGRDRWEGRCPVGTFRSWMRTRTRWGRGSVVRSACAPGPILTTRSVTGTGPRSRKRRLEASGSTPRTRPSATPMGTTGTRAAPTM